MVFVNGIWGVGWQGLLHWAISDITRTGGEEEEEQGGEKNHPVRKRPRNRNLEEKKRRKTALDPLKTTILNTYNTQLEKQEVVEEEDDDNEEEEEEDQINKLPPPPSPKKRSFILTSSSSSTPSSLFEYAHLAMADGHHHQQQNQSFAARMAVRNSGVGEIVEVQGGHIVRSTGRKDRHSKVCTAKGPRDRRVRLSAHTAIKFYDVQDRLGYDRPSKAVDWLIKNAKPAIDELEQLPPWRPSATDPNQVAHQVLDERARREEAALGDPDGRNRAGKKLIEGGEYGFQTNPSAGNAGFLPPSLDSDAIADTIKTFFPIGSSSTSSVSSSSIHLQSSQNQDLRLSLQSFQDPLLLQQHHHSTPSGEQSLFAGSAPMAFDVSAGWSQQEMGRFQPLFAWNAAERGGSSGGGHVFAAGHSSMPLLPQNPFFSQRGPLQSSNSPGIRAWMDPHHHLAAGEHQLQQLSSSSVVPAVGFASGGFSGFHIPARIQGEEEQDAANKLPSTSSAHRH